LEYVASHGNKLSVFLHVILNCGIKEKIWQFARLLCDAQRTSHVQILLCCYV